MQVSGPVASMYRLRLSLENPEDSTLRQSRQEYDPVCYYCFEQENVHTDGPRKLLRDKQYVI